METQISETLKDGSLDPKPVQSQNPDGETLENVSVLSSLSEICAGSEFATEVALSGCGESVAENKKLPNGDEDIDLEGSESGKLQNVGDNNVLVGFEFEKKLGYGVDSVELDAFNLESEAFVVGNLMEGGTLGLESQRLGSIILEDNEINDSDVPVAKLGSEFNDSQVIGIEKVDAVETIGQTSDMQSDVPVAKLDSELNDSQVIGVGKVEVIDAVDTIGHTTDMQEDDSPGKGEVSGDGISLIVEVFGPMDGMSSSCKYDQILGDGSSDRVLSMKNGSLMGGDGAEALEDASGNQEHNFTDGAEALEDASGNQEHNFTDGAEVEEDVSGNQEHIFTVGDLVWVKIKTNLWWPGMICDPSNASKDAARSDKRDCFFVKYFGNTNSAWCQPFQLKPFLQYFDQMSCHNKSKSFYGAIEKALGEIDRRVKLEMTCSCYLKESQVIAAQNNPSKDKRHGHGIFLASQFEPENFLQFIRLRALDVPSPGSIEFTVTKSCLAAFYSSIGHKQLPMYKLRPTNIAKDSTPDSLISVKKDEYLGKLSGGRSVLKRCRSESDDCKTTEVEMSVSLESPRGRGSMVPCSENAKGSAEGKSSKGFESRERKKSKYLSYPYVNSWGRNVSPSQGECETEDQDEVSLGGVSMKSPSSPSMVSTPTGNSSYKNSLRKSRKPVTSDSICPDAETITASSTEILQQLLLTALDCHYPNRSKSSISIQEFFFSFRSFRNHEVKAEMEETEEAASGCQETCLSSSGASKSDNFMASEGYNLQVQGDPSPSVLPKKRGKKRKDGINETGLKYSSIASVPSMTADNTMDGSDRVDSVGTGPDTLKEGTVRRKKKAATAPVLLHEISVMDELPDLNGNHAGLSVENMQVTGPAPTRGKLVPKRGKKNKEEFASDVSMPDVSKSVTNITPQLKDVQVMDSYSLEGIPQQDYLVGVQGASSLPNDESLARQPNANEGHVVSSSLSNNSQITGQLSSVKSEGKKRKRKEKPSNIQINSSVLPDLNGHVTEPNSKGKDLADLSSVASQGKPQRKRGRPNKSAIGIPNRNGNSIENTGNALQLNFGLESSVPTKESIIVTFSMFGSLVESETKFLNNLTAQVVFGKSSDAVQAFQSIQNSNPFGTTLASYHLHHVSTSNNLQMSRSLLPMDELKTPAILSGAIPTNGEGPDLLLIKQKLEVMTSMIDKAGDNLSPEMRANLESEVKGFLKKVSSMVGSSSS